MKMINLRKIKIKALSKTLSVLSFYFYKQKFNPYKSLYGIVFVFFGFSAQAQDKCKSLFTPEVFSKSMTENLELEREQKDLFHFYRASSFGDAKTHIKHNFNDLMEALANHSELSKEIFREQEITFGKRHYEAPSNLNNFIKRFTGLSGSLKSKLFYVSENLYFWQKLFGFNKSEQADFSNYLEDLLSAKERDYLADKSISYKERALFLYQVLDKAHKDRIKQGANVQSLSQVILDLVHTVGLGDPYYSALLKSKNAIDRLQALHKILDARDAMAIELGFEGHFLGLQETLGLSSPSSFSKKEDIYSMLRSIEKETLESSSSLVGSQTFRLRALSLQESPFRSCLGGSDCSSNTYFFKALDPNFTYWTLTDREHKSSGQITVVLGEAKDEKGESLKVGFVDKIQNVPTERVEPMLEGIRRSLEEKGYKLGLPQDVGNYNGLSNEQTTRDYVAKEINPKLERELLEFAPHENPYNFTSRFSRAYEKLPLYEFKAGSLEAKIDSGEIHRIQKAPEGLKMQDLFDQILSIRSSKKEEDQLRFIKQVELLYNLKVLSFEELRGDLMNWIKNKESSFKLRKLSLFTLIELYESLIEELLKTRHPTKKLYEESLKRRLSYDDIKALFSYFSEKEQKAIVGEMSNWVAGNHLKRNSFIQGLFMERQEIDSILKSEILKPIINASIKNLGPDVLMYAIKNTPAIAKLLIEKEIGIHSADIYMDTPLESAIMYNRPELVKLLIKKDVIFSVDNPLIHAIKYNQPGIAKFLIEKGIDINAVDSEGKNAFMYSIEKNQSEITKLLIEKGIDIHTVDAYGRNSLVYAIIHRQVKTAKLLVEKGINIHLVDSQGKNALMYAIQKRLPEMAKFLIEKGTDIYAIDSRGESALNYAIQYNQAETLKFLIEKGVDIHSIDLRRKNALMYAIERNQPEMVKLLLEKGADINSVNSKGESALIYAIRLNQDIIDINAVDSKYNETKIAKLLIQKGADIHVVDSSGKNALLYAIEKQLPEIAKLLIEKGADIHSNHLLINAVIYNQTAIAKLLIKRDIDIDAVNSYGANALMYAIKKQLPEIAKLLIEKGIDIDAVDSFGKNALVYAIQIKNLSIKPKIINLLIENDIDINTVDSKGKNALIYSLEYDEIEIAKLLIEKGADIHVVDSSGRNVLLYAIKRGNPKMAELLIEKGAEINAIDSYKQDISRFKKHYPDIMKMLEAK